MMKRLACAVLSVFLAAAPMILPAGSAEQEKLPVTSLDRLGQPGISIAVGLDTPAEAALRQDYPEATLIPYSDIFLAYLAVVGGRVAVPASPEVGRFAPKILVWIAAELLAADGRAEYAVYVA